MVAHRPGSRWSAARKRAGQVLAAAGFAAALAGCQHTHEVAEAPPPPNDYRLRHPIAIKEGARTVEVFVGRSRGTLTPAQRTEIVNFATAWRREATGGVVIDLPVGTPNHHAARDAAPEIRALLISSGVPADVIGMQSHRPADPTRLATVRVTYPKMTASAGPCGLWPQDLGAAYYNREYLENRPYWNFGCATQRNLAAMVDNPADLAQPRAETPALAQRRTLVLEKYRKGESPATHYPNQTEGKISDVGK